jgi:hypothetical protein
MKQACFFWREQFEIGGKYVTTLQDNEKTNAKKKYQNEKEFVVVHNQFPIKLMGNE